MALPVYFTGTVSVAAGGTVVTGAGVMWSGINAKQGDFISINNLAEVLITEVTDATHLKIAPWQGPAQSGAAYAIYQNYVGRVVGVAAAEDVGVMLEKLHVDGLPFILGADETVPDPSYGDEGQLAFKPSTGQWWEKTGGVWVMSFGLTALGYGGTSATSLLIGTGTKMFTTQGSLAYDGARVRAASAANASNWMEGIADYFGTTLTMTSDKIGGSGTHADWLFSIAGQPGVDGLGAGDMLAANNLSELTATAATARKNIYAAPFDALAYNGMQINGSMEVSQELGTAGRNTNGHVCDGWQLQSDGISGLSGAIDSAVPFPGIPNRLYINSSVAKPSLSAGDFIGVFHYIEGYRIARLNWGRTNPQPLTIGFWTSHSMAGLYSVAIRNNDVTRSYVTTYTQNVASAQEYKTVTIPGDVAGTWLTTNGTGLSIIFILAAGTTYTAPSANVWHGAHYLAAPGQINGVATASKYLVISGVVVLPGIEAPSAAQSPLIMRPYDQELVTCQRYFEKTDVIISTGGPVASGNGVTTWLYKVTKRSVPANAWGAGSTVFSVFSAGTDGIYVYAAGASPTIGSGSTANARL